MSRYASQTVVEVEKSKMQLEKLLKNHGAEGFVTGWDKHQHMVGFQIHGRHVKFVMPVPPGESFNRTPAGRERSPKQILLAIAQDERQRWRALALVVRAKLEMVESGMSTFEQEFMANIVLPNGQTVGEYLTPQIEHAYETREMPPLLPYQGESR